MTTRSPAHARLTSRTVPRADLTSREHADMFDLLSAFFTGVAPETFDADLDAKSHVILLEDDGGALRGFSTLLLYRTRAVDADATVVYSGDTIVHRESWGSAALPVAWLGAVRGLTASAAALDVYWLLLTSGFRTYRFLPVFWRDYYPRAGQASFSKRLVDALARERFGDLYDDASGIVRFTRPQVLIPELLDVPSGRARDDHVSFFLQRNPGFTRGDELVCLTRIADANLTGAGRRVARMLNGSSKTLAP
jgi:hypothetical protein